MTVLIDKTQFEKDLILSTIPLRKTNLDLEPVGIGSGLIAVVNEQKFIISAEHVINQINDGDWYIECEYEPERCATKLHRIGTPSMALQFNIQTGGSYMPDISWQRLPNDFTSIFQKFSTSGVLQASEPRKEFNILNEILPNLRDNYAFSGNIQPNYDPSAPLRSLETTWHVYANLKFHHSTDKFDYYRLPFEHPGHIFFEGCSGAPLVNQRFEVIGLISGYDDQLIRVLPLRFYLIMIQIEAGLFSTICNNK